MTPAVAVIEEVVLSWLRDLLRLPPRTDRHLVTGTQMANVTGLLAAHHQVLELAGWDVEVDGLFEGHHLSPSWWAASATPPSTERCATSGSGPQGSPNWRSTTRARSDPTDLARVLGEADGGPAIVCTQAGNVNTGAFDPIAEVCAIAHRHAAWVHVDGAFGLWAAASERHRHLLEGYEAADSWAVDIRKWLNAPYDCSVALTAHPDAHRAAMATAAAYLTPGEHREPIDLEPGDQSAGPGRALIATTSALSAGWARRRPRRPLLRLGTAHAGGFGAAEGAEVLNDVVLNQVLVRFGADDETTRQVIGRVQEDGTCWVGGTVWQGRAAMRFSVSNWSTTEDDIDRSVSAIIGSYDDVR